MNHYLIPVTLIEMESILLTNGYDELAKPTHISKIFYFIHKINSEYLINKKYKKGDFIRLSKKILEALFGIRYYYSIIDMLKALHIIEVDNVYEIGSFCKGYRLRQEYLSVCSKHIKLPSKFTDKITRIKQDEIKQYEKNAVYQNQIFNLNALSFDTIKVIDYLNKSLLEYNILLPIYYTLCAYNLEELKEQLFDKVNAETVIYDIDSIIFILNKDFHFKVDTIGNRLHTNLTNMSKGLRSCIVIDDCIDLVNIDIHCCQPTLLAIEMKEAGYNTPDLKKYFDICLNGDIYQYLLERTMLDINRDEFKKVFYSQVLFGKIYKNAVLDIFQNEFPTVFNFICAVKKKDYKQLAIRLQLLESNIIFKGVLSRIINGHRKYINGKIEDLNKPNRSFLGLTIHDGIVCGAEYGQVVYDTLKAVFNGRFDIDIQVTVKDLKNNTIEMIEHEKELIDEFTSEQLRKDYINILNRVNHEKVHRINTVEKQKEKDEFNSSILADFMEIV